MGIETTLVGLGMSAGTAAAVSTGLAVAGGVAAASALAPKSPNMPSIPTPEKPPQASKAPERGATSGGVPAGVMPGGAGSNRGTFLTGPSGIDPSTLNLGKNTLLGQ